jgi:hypothetical protein
MGRPFLDRSRRMAVFIVPLLKDGPSDAGIMEVVATETHALQGWEEVAPLETGGARTDHRAARDGRFSRG